MDPAADSRHFAGGILQLRMPKHEHVFGEAVVEERVAPGFLGVGGAVHVPFKEEDLPGPVIPAAAGGEHVAFFPEVYVCQEDSPVRAGFVVEHAGLDEDRVGEHVHVVPEGEHFPAGVVLALAALDYLPFAVTHGGAVLEEGYAVEGVVVEGIGAEGVVVAVFQLDHPAAAHYQVVVHEIVHLLAGEDGLVLDDLHVAGGIEHPLLDVVDGGVADEICAVVQEGGVETAPVRLAVLVQELHVGSLYKAYKAVFLLFFTGRKTWACTQKGKDQKNYFLTFCAHPLREKSQSPKSGSMMMYVSPIFFSTNELMASICLELRTIPSSSV